MMMNKVRPGYVAAVLDAATAEALRKLAVHANVHCHHITMAFRPTDEVYNRYERYLGEEMTFTIEEIVADEKGQAAVVRGIPTENMRAHVTISCADGIKPQYSNDLLASNATRTPYEFTGRATVTFIPF